MQNRMKEIFGLFLVVSLLAMAGCSFGGGGGASIAYSVIEDAAKETLPSYGSSSASAVSASASWDNGGPIYELYGVLEDSSDVQVGYFNLWDLIEAADTRFGELMTGGQEIEQISVTAPEMAVMTTAKNYNRYDSYSDGTGSSESFAMEDGDLLRLVTAFNVGTTEKSAVHAIYNEATGDLEMEMILANYVEEETTGWEMVRVYAEGNTVSHSFTIRIVRDGLVYDHNIVGAGVSEGSSNYFLLLLEDNEGVTSPRYYHIAADASVSDLQALSDAGFATAGDAGDPDNHEADLPAAFDKTTDLPADGDSMDLSMPDPTVIEPAAY